MKEELRDVKTFSKPDFGDEELILSQKHVYEMFTGLPNICYTFLVMGTNYDVIEF